jgi:hypothetical protein
MKTMRITARRPAFLGGLFVLLIACGVLLHAGDGACETYGIKDPQGNFVPKVNITVGKKDVLIKKTDPKQSFRSISITLNKNRNLSRNVGLLNLEWLDANNVPSKAIPFATPRYYNPATKVFQDAMIKSVGLRISEKTAKDLFAEKSPADLFTIQIDDEPLAASETVSEKERTVQMGTGRDVSIAVNKSVVEFNESNLKKGEILDVDNRSGLDQVIGVDLPDKSLLYFQRIGRKLEQGKIPRENWDRFTIPADSGIFIVLIPESDPALLAQLNGKEIVIKVYQGNRVRDTIRVPVRTSSDVRRGGALTGRSEPPTTEGEVQHTERTGPSRTETPANARPASSGEPAPASQPPRKQDGSAGNWLWVFQIFNLLLLGGLASYGVFFVIPKIQVLEDRLAKNEMFLHGSREAIREELERIKGEVFPKETKASDSE